MNNNLAKDMRLSRGLSVEEMANSIGVSKAAISRAENGHLTAEMKAKILRVHEMDDAFFFYVEQRKKADLYIINDNA